MTAEPPSTAKLAPDPLAVCAHIDWLKRELKLARRLLRIATDSRQRRAGNATTPHSGTAAEASHAVR